MKSFLLDGFRREDRQQWNSFWWWISLWKSKKGVARGYELVLSRHCGKARQCIIRWTTKPRPCHESTLFYELHLENWMTGCRTFFGSCGASVNRLWFDVRIKIDRENEQTNFGCCKYAYSMKRWTNDFFSPFACEPICLDTAPIHVSNWIHHFHYCLPVVTS